MGNKMARIPSVKMEETMKAPARDEKRPRFKGEGSDGEHPFGDRGQVICLVFFLLIWALGSFVFKGTTMLAAVVPLSVRLTTAGLAFVLGVYLVEKGHRVISDESFGDKGLIKDGVFARLRHPLYGGSLLFYLSLFLATLSLAALAVWCLMAVFYNVIAGYEERLLLENYGDEYLEYQQKVPKWVPRIRPAKFA
jgi:protein-S-isoprenylcysteine O-methyltransferase Ste14